MITAARRLAPLGAAALVLAGLTVVTAPPASALGPIFGSYEPTGPARVLDTRTGHGPVGAGHKIVVNVTGAGVPTSAEAVALTITVVSATRPGSITASTYGVGSPPGVTNVQFHPGRTATDLALVKPTNGKIDLWNVSAGRVQLVADLLGYYVGGGAPTFDGMLHTVTPKRAVRFAHGRIAPHAALTVNLRSAAGLPRSAGAVAATVTVVGPARAGSLVAYATNTTRPAAPLVDFAAARPRFTTPDSVSQFGILPLSDIQRLSLLNRSGGSLHVLVDVVGWFSAGPAAVTQSQQVVAANRIFADGVLPAHGADTVGVLGRGGVPKTGVSAVVVSARVAGPTRPGTLVGGAGAGPIVATFGPGRPATGQAILPVHNGNVRLRNASNGKLALEVDIVGYVVSTGVAVPANASVARYPNNLTQNLTHDNNVMTTAGNTDGDSGAKFVLLDLGAQSITGPQLSAAHPGVAITLTSPIVRLRYPQLTTVLNTYLAALGAHSGGRSITVAIGTNNDGDWTHYRASPRGRDWANLIDGLTAPANVTVVGANDIEANFGSHKVRDALDWVAAYLGNTSADFVYNGALNDCPTVFGMTAACAYGWTQGQYGQLTRRVVHGHNRIRVLPQIYFPVQAVQWANIYAHAGPLRFVGSLTQFAAAGSTFQPAQGWVALDRALQWKLLVPKLPFAVDIAKAAP